MKSLGEVLVESYGLTPEHIEDALNLQKEKGGLSVMGNLGKGRVGEDRAQGLANRGQRERIRAVGEPDVDQVGLPGAGGQGDPQERGPHRIGLGTQSPHRESPLGPAQSLTQPPQGFLVGNQGVVVARGKERGHRRGRLCGRGNYTSTRRK